MGINNIIYLTEVVVFAIAIIALLIMLRKKHKKVKARFWCIVSGVFILIFGATFLLEKPDMQINDIQTIEVKSDSNSVKPKTLYHFKDVTNDVTISGNVDYNKIGEYEVKYEVNTLFGKFEKQGKIKIVDTTAPEITLEGGEDYKQSYSKDFEEPGFKAIDNYDGDLTKKVKTTKSETKDNKFEVKYEVEDSSGNKAEKIRKVTIVDDIAPVITLNGSENMTVMLDGEYEEPGATAEDEKDGDLTEKIKTEGSVDTSKEDTYTISYKVSDNSGNEAVKERKVTVRKKLVYTPKAQNGSSGEAGVIYLTFDDGPSTNITPQILDILKDKNVKATFFILNYNEAGEELIKREYNEGHTVAIHGYSHDYNTIYQSESAYMSNLTKLQDKIKATTGGYIAKITRFPGGSSNTVSKYNPGIMTRLCSLVVENGFKYFDWNVSSGDAGGAQDADDVYNNVTSGLSKSRANVVLMHDFSSNSKVVEALPRIIDYGIENGYEFSNITESTEMVTHKPNN